MDMLIAMLLMSAGVAVIGAGAVWAIVGFWWALVAYPALGTVTLLLTASALHLEASRGEPRRPLAIARLGTAD